MPGDWPRFLEVDAVVVGVVTEYTPYYPPRMTLQVSMVRGQSELPSHPGRLWPAVGNGGRERHSRPAGVPGRVGAGERATQDANSALSETAARSADFRCTQRHRAGPIRRLAFQDRRSKARRRAASMTFARSRTRRRSRQMPPTRPAVPATAAPATLTPGETVPEVPPILARPARVHSPAARCPAARGVPSDEPVMQHMKSYRGNDAEFTTALENYYYSRDDARLGGWQNYLQRSDDFIRFCCRLHIWEMLGARGGAGETRVVWRWSPIR